MIMGNVNSNYEAVIRLRVRGPLGHELEVDAIVDTGFNGFLTLPPFLISELESTRLSRGRALLANGSEELFDIHGLSVEWDGEQRLVEVDAVNAAPLVGMALLDGFDLHIRVVNGGHVIIQSSDHGSPH